MNELFIALIGALGSCLGTVVGIFVNTKLINYRLEKLEEKVNKHNNLSLYQAADGREQLPVPDHLCRTLWGRVQRRCGLGRDHRSDAGP